MQRVSRFVGSLGVIGIVGVLTAGCGFGAALLSTKTDATAERLDPGGKGLFTLRPPMSVEECRENVHAAGSSAAVQCDAEFIVGCDASLPEDQPFCYLMKEKGPVRDSLYPAARR
jgi:hypothetical protein